ncbi:sugar-binding domain-containing protein [Microbacterium sp. M3]|uniref:Sugar-binding domain-containing protein n=1 Tax=Microbacterium arthrosphaerae TaxID=792652 RepID=A0ABU4H3D4_9MICO|nr:MULTISPECIES: sugar-binding domain-containing protein [Microbacterium]MDW4573164.1 sugar-binding domain-containing protein [Microbacterium arthrosphaerae]MDW7607019.1 sugar-binding domain-containing protein [Microbacterium sp. M3]
MDAVDELLSIRAAELYYEENLTQEEIGRSLQITRWKVGRLLTQAKEEGFVRIEILHSRARRPQLERRLRDERELTDAVVVSRAGVRNEDELQQRVAQAAADYLATLHPRPRVLGLSWGRTLADVAHHLRDGWSTATDVVQINGGVSMSQRPGTAAATAVSIAQKGGGAAALLPSPAILEQRATKEAIEADRVVARVLGAARSADAYLFSAGAADHRSVHVDSGYLSPADIDRLVASGAVGDVLGRYIDADGRIVDRELDARTVGLSLDELRRADVAIAAIAGEAKRAVAAAVVGSGLCTVLVTDESTAHHLLDG